MAPAPRTRSNSAGPRKIERALDAVEVKLRLVIARRNKILRTALARNDSKKIQILRSSLGGKK